MYNLKLSSYVAAIWKPELVRDKIDWQAKPCVGGFARLFLLQRVKNSNYATTSFKTAVYKICMIGSKKINKVLIIKPSSIGDIVHSLPTLVALKKLLPEASISWVVFSHLAEILEGNIYLNEVIKWDRGKGLGGFFCLIKFLRQKKYDLLIDLQGLFRTGFLAMLSGAKIKLGVPGLRELSYLFCKEVGKYDPKEHAVRRNLRVVHYLGQKLGKCDDIFSPKVEFPIHISLEDSNMAIKFLQENNLTTAQSLIGIGIGAGMKHKRWPVENYITLCNTVGRNYQVILFGSKEDSLLVELILRKTTLKPISAVGKISIKIFAEVVKHCKVFISADTGPLHIACAVGVPVIGLYGPTDPAETGPYSTKAVVLYKRLPCSPCRSKPTCKDYQCMKLITVDDVIQAINA